eukprot:CAMPEP_0114487220 /NCGR_PEP_ID=MMETSP0109-20121206/646_1 /TAXON_ID=29199 /ORGANISM="Chlorarachnion reptans, Strain CCCM449" /LENGTH=475 /DNA_ID=CAMNT_0001663463 /DNA_START=59 /DNA_END=1483 /DNA_ORIENTATION=+
METKGGRVVNGVRTKVLAHFVNPHTQKARGELAITNSFAWRRTEADKHMKDGRPDLAVTSLSAAIFLKPNIAELYEYRAEIYIQLCDFGSAILNYRKALSLCPREKKFVERMARIMFVRGRLHVEDEELDQAIDAFKEAAKLVPTNPQYELECARIYFSKNLCKTALDSIENILASHPDYTDAYHLRAKILIRLGEYSMAKIDIENVEKRDSNDVRVKKMADLIKQEAQSKFVQATQFYTSGLNGQCIALLSNTLAWNPTVEGYRLRATAFRTEGKFNASIADLKCAMQLVQSKAEETNHSHSDMELKDIQRQLAFTLNDIGICLLNIGGKVNEAIDCFRKAISRWEREPQFHANLADSYKELNQLDNALKYYQKAFSILADRGKTDGDIYHKVLTGLCSLRYDRGRRMFNNTNYMEAEQEYSHAIRLSPNTAMLRFCRGESRLQLLNLLGAYFDFKKAVELDPKFNKAQERWEW